MALGVDTIALLQDYAVMHPQDSSLTQEFLALAAQGQSAYQRTRAAGHFTASCWLVSGDGTRVLLTHHRKLGRWLQLGGHADGDQDLPAVALREAMEESGLAELHLQPEIFDLDAHRIPARPDEAEHTHWDVRFVVHCAGNERYLASAESLALAWVPITELLHSPDASLRRMAEKWARRRAR